MFKYCLRTLCHRTMCSHCQKPIDDVRHHSVGSMFAASMVCIEGHQSTWRSQPMIRHMPVGNLLLSASVLFTGNTYEHVAAFANCINIEFISSKSFYDRQRSVLLPVLQNKWEYEQQKLLQELSQEDGVDLAGDGICDSPGYSSKYCTHSLMHNTSQKIIHYELLQVTYAGSSTAMEKIGLVRGMNFINEHNININQLTTDRHIGIRHLLKSYI